MEYSSCIICNSSKSIPFITLNDRLCISKEKFYLIKCECGFIYLNPRPAFDEISIYYDNSKYDPHNIQKKDFWNYSYNTIKKITNRWKKYLINDFYKSGNLLDIGGGVGSFAKYMDENNWNVSIQDSFSKIQNQNINYFKDLNEIKKYYHFDVITMWHSLEHIHGINKLFHRLHVLLKNNGILIAAVPNINAPERKYFKENWAPFDAPRHLYHFSPNKLQELFTKNGFKVLKIKSLYQDLPYNIILSISKKSILSIVKSLFIFIMSFLSNLILGPEKSSSFLIICQKK